jgi:integrase
LDYDQEDAYLAAAPQPLRDAGMLMLDTALRSGEAVRLLWTDLHLKAAINARHGYLTVREGGSKKRGRTVQLTPRVAEMLLARRQVTKSVFVFPGTSPEAAILTSSLDQQHNRVREALKFPKDFVIHSLRHTMLTRLGEAGADAFTIQRIAGHSSVTVSQRYVHPSEESAGRALERLDALNAAKRGVPTKVPTPVVEMPMQKKATSA